MPGQGRLVFSRLRVPNLDGFVIATAGNLLSRGGGVRTNARSPSTRTYKKELTKIKRKLTCPCAPSPGTHKRTFRNHLHFCIFRAFISLKKPLVRVAGHTGALKQAHDFVVIF